MRLQYGVNHEHIRLLIQYCFFPQTRAARILPVQASALVVVEATSQATAPSMDQMSSAARMEAVQSPTATTAAVSASHPGLATARFSRVVAPVVLTSSAVSPRVSIVTCKALRIGSKPLHDCKYFGNGHLRSDQPGSLSDILVPFCFLSNLETFKKRRDNKKSISYAGNRIQPPHQIFHARSVLDESSSIWEQLL